MIGIITETGLRPRLQNKVTETFVSVTCFCRVEAWVFDGDLDSGGDLDGGADCPKILARLKSLHKV